jgi:hypothetical protein
MGTKKKTRRARLEKLTTPATDVTFVLHRAAMTLRQLGEEGEAEAVTAALAEHQHLLDFARVVVMLAPSPRFPTQAASAWAGMACCVERARRAAPGFGL